MIIGRKSRILAKVKNKILAIGIDPGSKTGLSIKDLETGKYTEIITTNIIEAQDKIRVLREEGAEIYLVLEDARKRTIFGNTGSERWQGAGSIKGECRIWETFLKTYKVKYRLELPAKKITHGYFIQITKWVKRTSQHSRDASMLIFGLNKNNVKFLFQ